jgi:hypothetical protein
MKLSLLIFSLLGLALFLYPSLFIAGTSIAQQIEKKFFNLFTPGKNKNIPNPSVQLKTEIERLETEIERLEIKEKNLRIVLESLEKIDPLHIKSKGLTQTAELIHASTRRTRFILNEIEEEVQQLKNEMK